MKKPKNTARLVRKRVKEKPLGEPFTPRDFLSLGTRASIDKALSRLVTSGDIKRVTRGLFVRPEVNRFTGPVSPGAEAAAKAFAKSRGETIQVQGADAALNLGLSTQVPMKPVYWTSGPTRQFNIGRLTVYMKHVSKRKLVLAERPAGMAITAMWYMGKSEVTPEVIEKIRRQLPAEEFEALKSVANEMPAWMREALARYQRHYAPQGNG